MEETPRAGAGDVMACGSGRDWLEAEDSGARRRTRSAPAAAAGRLVQGAAGGGGTCSTAQRLPGASDVLARFQRLGDQRQLAAAERTNRSHSLESRSPEAVKRRLVQQQQVVESPAGEPAASCQQAGAGVESSPLQAPPLQPSPDSGSAASAASDPRRLAVLQRRRLRPRLLPDVPSPARRVLRLASESEPDPPLLSAGADPGQGCEQLLEAELGAGLLQEAEPVSQRALADADRSRAAGELESPGRGQEVGVSASSRQDLESPVGEAQTQGTGGQRDGRAQLGEGGQREAARRKRRGAAGRKKRGRK